ncbi:MAG: flagellar export protein FliJ [Bacillota bacterium]|nr:flagellar export protein FliJ [Bacillota bacterium]MDW7683012.1 flagellar export protein FliJ [Bacillota bacterium]
MYVFKLQKVLDYRKRKEDEEQLRLSQAHLDTEAAKNRLALLKEDLQTMQKNFALCQSSRVDIPSAVLACDYTAHLAARIRESEKAVAELESKLRSQVSLTEKAMQERKVMDTLRDNGCERYRYEVHQAEQRHNDEMAQFMYLRKGE